MGQCKLFLDNVKDKLYAEKIISPNNKILNEERFYQASGFFKKEFGKIYSTGLSVGLGSVSNGVVTFNNEARKIEESTRKKAKKRFKGVNLQENKAIVETVNGEVELILPEDFAYKAYYSWFDTKDKEVIGVVQPDKSVKYISIDDAMKLNNLSGFTNLFVLLSSKLTTNLAGLSVSQKRAIIKSDTKGTEFADTVEKEAAKYTSPHSYMEDLITQDTGISEEVKGMNEVLNRALVHTGTKFSLTLKRGYYNNQHGGLSAGNATASHINLHTQTIGRNVPRAKTHLGLAYIHEKGHVVTLSLLAKDKRFRRKMEDLFQRAKDAGVKGYGMNNIAEFATESLANKELQEQLRNVKYEKENVFSMFKKILIEALERISGIKIGNDLLSDILLTQFESMASAEPRPLNGRMTEFIGIMEGVELKNGFAKNKGDVARAQKAAKAVGMRFVQGKGFQYFENGVARTVNQENVGKIVNKRVANYTFTLGSRQGESLPAEAQTPPITPDPFDLDTIHTLDDVKAAQDLITPPSQSESEKYEIASKEYFRTTESLGFGVTEAQTDDLLANAAAIGNFKDELGKRIFRGDPDSEITYDKVAELVKQEAFDRAKREGIVDEEQWLNTYNNPVSVDSFAILKNELAAIKDDLMTNGNVKEFHTDMIVWDNDTRVAGEIDVLAELHDGSYTVIDLKTRRKGMLDYANRVKGNWSTKEKHTKQTNTYSNMLEKMGFRMNAPKIIMSQPDYHGSGLVKEADFLEIEPGKHIAVIDLERQAYEDMFDYRDPITGVNDPYLRDKSNNARKRYFKFFNRQMRLEGIEMPEFELNEEEALKEVKAKMEKIRRKLQSYKNITKADPTSGTLSVDLDRVLNLLNSIKDSDMDDIAFDQQLIISKKFFEYAAKQLAELTADLTEAFADPTSEMDTYLRIKRYEGVFHTAQELFEVLKTMSHGDISEANKAIFLEVEKEFNDFEGISAELGTQLNITRKNLYRHIIAQSYLGSKGEIKMNKILEKEARDKFGDDENKIKAYMAEEKRKEGYQTRVREASREEVNELLNSPAHDIMAATFFINDDLSINNEFVQLFNKMIMNAELQFTQQANAEVIELAQLHTKLDLSEEELKGITVVDKDGNHFLMGDYKVEFLDEYHKLQDDIADLTAKRDAEEDPETRMGINEEIRDAETRLAIWVENNTKGTDVRFPIDSWKTDYSKLSQRQKEALDYFKGITEKNQDRITNGANLYKSYQFNVHMYKLPSVKRTGFAHVMEGNFLKAVKRQWDDATKIEVGDTEEGQVGINAANGEETMSAPLGLDGKPIYINPVFFRGKLQGDQQSLDLFTIYALEIQNGIRHKVNGGIVAEATIFLDVVNNADFIQTSGGKTIISKFAGAKDEAATMKGYSSNVAKVIEKMMKSRIYSMSQEYSGNVFGKDVNRLVSVVSSYTAFASMSFKALGAANNWVTGQVSTFIEAAGGEFFDKKGLVNAKATYWNNIHSILKDMGQQVRTSKINQILNILHVTGDEESLTNEFERKNLMTKLAKGGNSMAGYSMGEHEIAGVITIAILQSQKIINSEGKYLDMEGNVVADRKDAASLYDALQKNDKGVVELAEWAEYSEFDPINKLHETGLATIKALIKERITRTQGAYDRALAGQLNRLWWGKLIMQFKKHLPPQMLNRFRGIDNVHIPTDKLADSKKYYNYKAKTEEYGYYVTFLRSIINIARVEKLNILAYKKAGSDEWENLSEHERANIRKALTELSYIATTLIMAALLKASIDGDDDDNDTLWALVYLLRRQADEGGLQYIDPTNNWRVVESPMAAINKVNTTLDVFKQMFSPTEEYHSGPHSQENKLLVKAKKMAIVGDIIDQFDSGFNERAYNNYGK